MLTCQRANVSPGFGVEERVSLLIGMVWDGKQAGGSANVLRNIVDAEHHVRTVEQVVEGSTFEDNILQLQVDRTKAKNLANNRNRSTPFLCAQNTSKVLTFVKRSTDSFSPILDTPALRE